MPRCARCNRFKLNSSLTDGYCAACAELNKKEAEHKRMKEEADRKRAAEQKNPSIEIFRQRMQEENETRYKLMIEEFKRQRNDEQKRLAVKNGSIHDYIRDRFYQFNQPSYEFFFNIGDFPYLFRGYLAELTETEDDDTGELYFYNVESWDLYKKKELGKPCPDMKARLEASFDKMLVGNQRDDVKIKRYKADFLEFFTELDAVVYEIPESLRKDYEDAYFAGVFDALIVQSYDFWFLFEIGWGYHD